MIPTLINFSSKTRTPIFNYTLPTMDSVISTVWMSDVHWDNPDCDRGLFLEHLQEARHKRAGIFIFGDFFCAMQGKYDPRKKKGHILEEHNVPNYLDALVYTAAEFLEPFSPWLRVISYGNHETSIMQKHETDLTTRLVRELALHGSPVLLGGYGGYLQFRFKVIGNTRTRYNIWYNHGSGGGGPATKGANKVLQRAAVYGDADIVFTGHIHEEWIVTQKVHRIDHQGDEVVVKQRHVQMGTYKDEYKLGRDPAYHNIHGRPPKPLGCWFVDWYPKTPRKNAAPGWDRRPVKYRIEPSD